MLTKDNVTIGIEWRFGPDWPGPRCGAKTRRGVAEGSLAVRESDLKMCAENA